MKKALEGVRIIDLTAVIAGPLGMRTLADYGADVIKVEAPGGDIIRASQPTKNPGMGVMHLQLNRNKRSIVLDLKSPQAVEVMHRLLEKADVFAHNLRPDALRRLGLDYETCRTRHPGLIHAGVIGFGHRGRNRDKPAYDDLIQGAGGLAALFGSADSPPRYVPLNVVDRLTGGTLTHAVLAALFHRERTGEGQRIEIPMYETLVEFTLGDHLQGETYEPAVGPTINKRATSSSRRPYRSKDGMICVVPNSDKHWQEFFRVSGLDATYGKDPRFATPPARAANINDALALVAEVIPSKTTAEWMDLLTKADIPCGPMQTYDEVLHDPHLSDAGFFKTVEHPTEGTLKMPGPAVWMSQTEPSMRLPAPRLGEHTRELLSEHGYGDVEIDALLESGIAAAAK